MICGNDGGIQRTADNLAATVAWTDIANAYRTYQYYYVALDPRSGNTKVIGGAQDNGTTRNIGGSGVNFERILSGDGASVGLSDNIAGITYEYAGAQNGIIYRRQSTYAPNFADDIRPTAATDNGLFVTLFKLDDDNTQILYYASDSSLYRNTSASSATNGNWTAMTGVQNGIVLGNSPKTQITALATSRGSYSASTSSLFLGTNRGKLFRLDDPANAALATAPVDITGAGFPANAYLSSIAVNPRNDDTVLVTFSNYGVVSVWWTGNANSATPTWQNVEGTFTAPSYRSSAIALSNGNIEYFVGTSVGLYKATINGASPGTTSWLQEGAGDFGNAVVTALALRPADNKLLAGTHGAGMWTTTLALTALPVTILNFDGRLDNNTGLLNWTTSAEYNSKDFELEKSTDGVHYAKMATLTAAGNSNAERKYSYRDIKLSAANYYRLKMNDLDGNNKLSNVVLLRYNESRQNVVILNTPFHNYIDLKFAKPGSQATIQLSNVAGVLVAQKIITNPWGQTRWNIPGQLSSGSYIVRTVVDGEVFTSKTMRQ
jgi:hypothetical protein